MILVTGASGHLGHLVIQELLKTVPASQIVAGARNLAKVQDLAASGIQLRELDYDRPDTIQKAVGGVTRILLISASEVGKRVAQHKNVIEVVKQLSGLQLFAYTSILRTDNSPLMLAEEHRATEQLIQDAKLPYVFLRNGWYSENYTENLAPVLQHGAVVGAAKDGKFSFASRLDYATAAAKILSSDGHAGKVYELAGDVAFTLTEYAALVAKESGKSIVYQDMTEADFKSLLINVGLPDVVAGMLSNSDVAASKGALFDDSKTLSKLIGRPTTPLAESIKAGIAQIRNS